VGLGDEQRGIGPINRILEANLPDGHEQVQCPRFLAGHAKQRQRPSWLYEKQVCFRV